MAKVAGVDVLLYAMVGTTKTVVGGQSGATLNRETNVIEVTSKESGWAENLAGVKSWSIECEGYVVVSDSAYDALETAWENGTEIDVEVRVPSGNTYSGKAIISEFPLEAPQDDALTFSLTLQGSGALVKAKTA
ncbi:phage major tail protein, TP901-1 family [Neobacillus rhizosphaerae]|uniref:phage tail tube protein n=1 Tax=Neobacillus rhizosphaerae TaxID=2880965 RepID=UPI003D26F1F6